jgi:hypothetical protein
MQTNETEWAWAAGFFDGEGYVAARMGGHRRTASGELFRYRRIEIQITQMHPDVLERFRLAVGRGSIGGPYADKRGNRGPMYKYATAGYVAVSEIFDRIGKYLSPVKAEQVRRAFALYETLGGD